MTSRRSPSPCRVHTEFQSFRITFGEAQGSSDTSDDDRAIRTLQEIAEEHPDIADAARYCRTAVCQLHIGRLCAWRYASVHFAHNVALYVLSK